MGRTCSLWAKTEYQRSCYTEKLKGERVTQGMKGKMDTGLEVDIKVGEGIVQRGMKTNIEVQ